RRARQQRARHAELATDLLDGQEVLLGERLSRRHQRALLSRLHCAEQRVERDDGLPRADVALQKPLHRNRAAQVAVDLCDRALLVLGEKKRERRAISSDQLTRVSERRCDLRFAFASSKRETDLQEEELVECKTCPPSLGFFEGTGTVQRPHRVGTLGLSLTLTQVRGQRI